MAEGQVAKRVHLPAHLEMDKPSLSNCTLMSVSCPGDTTNGQENIEPDKGQDNGEDDAVNGNNGNGGNRVTAQAGRPD